MSVEIGSVRVAAKGERQRRGDGDTALTPLRVNQPKMDIVQAVKEYVTNMISDVSGMKVLLLDTETLQMVSMAYTQSQILQREVYLVEKLELEREQMLHMKAVCFLRPTGENIAALARELRSPKYAEYHLFFSNTLLDAQVVELAHADEHEVVSQVHEYFADVWAVNPCVFSLNQPSIAGPTPDTWDALTFGRTVDGLFSTLLALKKRPNVRFAGRSEKASRLAEEVKYRMQQDAELFEFDLYGDYGSASGSRPLLLIMDRRDDPITPLLSQWTYQAMVHELLGITNQRVDLSGVRDVRKDMHEVVLSAEQDEFYRQVMYQNFGDLGVSLKELLDRFQAKTNSNKSVSTIADMKRFIEDYPEFKRMSGNVSKHVALTSELSRQVEERGLMACSELEQEMACSSSGHGEHLRALRALLDDTTTGNEDALRLVLIYALRYETNSSNACSQLVSALFERGLTQADVQLISDIVGYGGTSVRGGDLFKNKSILKKLKKRYRRGLEDIENVFTQHVTLLEEVIDEMFKGKLREEEYPYALGSPSRDPPSDIIVFFVGGMTYEEAAYAARLNASGTGVRIVVGGNYIHNSRSFLNQVAETMTNAAPSASAGASSSRVTTASGVRAKYRPGGSAGAGASSSRW
ncbi:vacuolar protein sorting 45A [Thecamonas trahens ATCC 50062]|uniref:Vacuolar protein sorting 45A n=1 Tax=Thecamonas trahens ATCC 50062 TaxID=461836 RepID=A0A0L0DHA5_THETB|nr:vacuolar protein sorting 45A [Thecamonas trahens ATCC 50062]KNC51521.1 vacuolar protein sorting 45A [Thecamonas trahens ATCC 50062]|eukprot:XP_013755924.1 vacuolar protein sorting 45A [Thecamonas trahens ATCC 50062]